MRKILLLLCILGLFSVYPIIADSGSADAIKKGDAFFEDEKFKDAINTYNQGIQQDSSNAVLYEKKAETLIKLKRYKEALIAINKSLEIDATSESALILKNTITQKLEPKSKVTATSTPVPSSTTITNRGKSNVLSVTITGLPNDDYILWVKDSSSMTGLSGDEPPMILPGQDGIKQDNSAGPIMYGRYQIYGGGGKTVKQDVPDDPDYHGTRYYADVMLNSSGTRTVELKTTKDTKDKMYSIRVERMSGNQYISDEIDITVEKGYVTIVSAGDQSSSLGETVKLSGAISDT